jgi:hypothetical protein
MARRLRDRTHRSEECPRSSRPAEQTQRRRQG